MLANTEVLSKNNTLSIKAALPWLVCFSAAMFFFYEFIQMQMFNSISNELMRDFGINAEQLGHLSATYFYADVIFLFPAGILLDRYSTRTIIIAALVLCILGTLLFAFSTSVWFAAACHFIAGIGNAFCFLSCIRLASRWFPPKKMALVVGLIVTIAMTGGVVAQTPLTLLKAVVGWRNALLLNAALGVMIMGLIWRYVQDYPAEQKEHHLQQQQQLQSLGFWKSIRLALANTQNWLCGLYTSLLNLPIMLLCALWGDLYLTQVNHLSNLQASYVVTMIFIGTIIGGPIIGWISDRIALRRWPMILGAIFSLLVVIAIMYLPNLSFWSLILSFFLLGFFTSAQVLGYPVIAESNPRMLTSTSMGLASVLIMGGAAVFQPIFGAIMDSHWQGVILNKVHIYPPEAYHIAMTILPLAFIAGLIMTFFIRETYCREEI